MRITRKSIISGAINTIDIQDLTQDMLDAWENGMHIQDAMATLSKADREFIMSGITQEEWDEVFGDEDEDTSGM